MKSFIAERSWWRHGPGQCGHRPDHSQAVPEIDQAQRVGPTCLTTCATWTRDYPGQDCSRRPQNPIFRSTRPATRVRPSCWRGKISAAAPAASTPPGHWRITAFAASSHPALPIFLQQLFQEWHPAHRAGRRHRRHPVRADVCHRGLRADSGPRSAAGHHAHRRGLRVRGG